MGFRKPSEPPLNLTTCTENVGRLVLCLRRLHTRNLKYPPKIITNFHMLSTIPRSVGRTVAIKEVATTNEDRVFFVREDRGSYIHTEGTWIFSCTARRPGSSSLLVSLASATLKAKPKRDKWTLSFLVFKIASEGMP